MTKRTHLMILVVGLAAWTTLAATDADKPILPGWGQYYWNANAKWYIHPPAFAFKDVKGAKEYRFRVIADGATTNFFTAASAKADLSPVWPKLPKKSYVELVCEGVDAQGAVLGKAGAAKFWKSAPFKAGSYPKMACPYGTTANRAYRYIFDLKMMKVLANTGLPDFSYAHNCYPSKMNSAVINAALGAAESDPSRKDAMLKLAHAAADYLISTAEPADAPLAHFTQTYLKGSDKLTAKDYQGQHMLIYPAGAASAILKLYKACGEKKYLEAAENIAGTYLKLQGEDGTWYLKMWAKDGTPVNPNRLTPMGVIDFLEALYGETKKPEYRAAADRAFAFIEKGPFATWNWEGQFEDIVPSKPYQNLTKHTAVDTAMYLLKRYPGDKVRREQARALIDFSEDQFVAWEKPCRADGFAYPNRHGVKDWWCFPTVMEQYDWYVPTDSSVAKMIRGYLALYAVEKDPTDLAKAKALGDAFTHAQRENGRIPTQWMGGEFKWSPSTDWINCMISSANAMTQLAAVEAEVDGAWLKGTTDKDPLAYRCGETMTFTVTPMGFAGSFPDGACFLNWKRTDDHGGFESGRVPFDGKTPFVYRGKLDKPGFVRLEASVDYAAGGRFGKKSFFDGGACADADKVVPAAAPKDFDEFWKRQYARLDRVPVKADRIARKDAPTNVTVYAVRIDCAGLRPVTGYLTVPKGVAAGQRYPARLQTHGYSGDSCIHFPNQFSQSDTEIVLNINAHGLKLQEFGATDADTKALRWEIRSHDKAYAFDPLQNADPEVAYFNGMVLRVKRALQYLKTVEGWNGKDLIASGGSQGGLQTIWAAGCGEGVTRAESGITWCCDMEVNANRSARKQATGGWYVPWTPAMGYYDSVNFARKIPASCRTVVTRAGIGDYVCPPLGLLKLYYAIPGNKEIHWMQGSEHGYQPPFYEGRDTMWSAK